jgi:SCP-2 sterol transfer family
VARYLSDEWLADVERALASAAIGRDAGDLVVQHRVTGGPEGGRCFHIALGRAGARLQPGEVPDADVTFTQDYETAAAIARGELSAQAAFMSGQMRVGGDLGALVEHQRSLQDIDDLLASVRAETTYA